MVRYSKRLNVDDFRTFHIYFKLPEGRESYLINKSSFPLFLPLRLTHMQKNMRWYFYRWYIYIIHKYFFIVKLKCPSFYQPRQQTLKRRQQAIFYVLRRKRRESKQYIPHEYILLTDRNDTSDRWVSTDAKASRRFWYRKYFEYLENIGYPKARCIQRLELQVASGFRDASRYPVCITIEIPRKVHVHRKYIRVLSFRFAPSFTAKLIRALR